MPPAVTVPLAPPQEETGMSGHRTGTTTDTKIFGRITEMTGEERQPREELAAGSIDRTTEHGRPTRLEAELDQCRHLLQQRRAHVAADEDPKEARVRPIAQVEHYRS
ncbi:DUF2630 family protein [Streptomyces canus]|uniref:DUF2630 family protein n=1 Tax=Streptomyces canus TaxID=58343 RepID=UPI00277DC8DE|nr:DUF2630 family protein [Streptomyces canus]MDQ1065079.1 hypothetical protein [Streptomyces canus]